MCALWGRAMGARGKPEATSDGPADPLDTYNMSFYMVVAWASYPLLNRLLNVNRLLFLSV